MINRCKGSESRTQYKIKSFLFLLLRRILPPPPVFYFSQKSLFHTKSRFIFHTENTESTEPLARRSQIYNYLNTNLTNLANLFIREIGYAELKVRVRFLFCVFCDFRVSKKLSTFNFQLSTSYSPSTLLSSAVSA